MPKCYFIPTNLTYYFEGLNGENYTLNFSDLLGNFMSNKPRLEDRPNGMPNNGSLLKYNAKNLVVWAHEKVDNVKLVNSAMQMGI